MIKIERPSPTGFRYPWQQAMSAHTGLFGAGSRFEKISSAYVSVGHTKAFEVCYRERDGGLEVVKVPVLLQPGTERMFEFSAPSLREGKESFDELLRALR